jgi:hypothetical protein
MANQTITTRMKFKGYQREWHKNVSGCVFENSGWGSVKEMQKELMRRFPDGIRQRRTRKTPTGLVRVEGPWHDRITQVITHI